MEDEFKGKKILKKLKGVSCFDYTLYSGMELTRGDKLLLFNLCRKAISLKTICLSRR